MLKRKQTTLTLQDKYDIIKQLEDGVPVSILVHKYDISRQAIREIKLKKDRIVFVLSTQPGKNLNPKMKEDLLVSYTTTVEKLQRKLLEKVQEMDLKRDQVYNVKSVRLLWNFLPGTRLDISSFVPCANATGSHKLKLLVTGKSPLHKAYENCFGLELPVVYLFQKPDATNLLVEWFHYHFIPEVKSKLTELNLPHKALLLMDKSPDISECLSSEDGNIQVMFLPTFCDRIHPLNQELMETIKQDFKESIVRWITLNMDRAIVAKDVEQVNKPPNVGFLQATYTLRDTWLSFPADVIQDSWLLLWPDLNNVLTDGSYARQQLQERLSEDGEASTETCSDLTVKPPASSDPIDPPSEHADCSTSQLATSSQSNSEQRRKRSKVDPKMDEELLAWYTKLKGQGHSVTETMLCYQANQLHKKIVGRGKFQASPGWLDRFKRRHELVLDTVLLEDLGPVKEFQKKMLEKVQEMGLSPDQVYNAKRVHFVWNFLPGMRLDVTSFMPCANATGSHKLLLLVTGKSPLPESYKNYSEVGVVYHFPKTKSDAANVLVEWFHYHFVPEVMSKLTELNLPHKALLLMEKNSDLPDCLCSEDGNIQVLFLPGFCWKIQPLDQEIVEKIKKDYKYSLMTWITSKIDLSITQDVNEVYKTRSVDLLRDTWLSIPTELIRESWHRLWPDLGNLLTDENYAWFWIVEDDQTRPEGGLEGDIDNSAEFWMIEDDQTSSETIEEIDDFNETIIKTDIEIDEEDLKVDIDNSALIQEEQDSRIEIDEDLEVDIDNSALIKEEEDSRLTNDRVSDEEALKSVDVCIQWCMENNVADHQLFVLMQIRNEVATAQGSNIKQEPLDSLIV